ncbi:hypothetical protein QYM36_011440 [Artemia franciscana]|uniref:Uncharacterized protein n=1 Tax=Artemia franciscana TaxID=6661 RepID=A0AA88HPI3_ARTSF|nr:hypothetical protein QYM36_011440 [Artemia franciscana]
MLDPYSSEVEPQSILVSDADTSAGVLANVLTLKRTSTIEERIQKGRENILFLTAQGSLFPRYREKFTEEEVKRNNGNFWNFPYEQRKHELSLLLEFPTEIVNGKKNDKRLKVDVAFLALMKALDTVYPGLLLEKRVYVSESMGSWDHKVYGIRDEALDILWISLSNWCQFVEMSFLKSELSPFICGVLQ